MNSSSRLSMITYKLKLKAYLISISLLEKIDNIWKISAKTTHQKKRYLQRPTLPRSKRAKHLSLSLRKLIQKLMLNLQRVKLQKRKQRLKKLLKVVPMSQNLVTRNQLHKMFLTMVTLHPRFTSNSCIILFLRSLKNCKKKRSTARNLFSN
jgi:hypothetical protein